MTNQNVVSGGIVGVVLFATSASAVAAVFRVTTTGAGIGNTWGTACNLDYALSHGVSGDSIWVKKGTYYRGGVGPVPLNWGVKLIGGFAGTESYASQSNPTLNLTILHGGLSDTDPSPRGRVVVSGTYDSNAPTNVPLLRGFKIMNGKTADDDFDGGGGMRLDYSALIVRCEFAGNQALWAGAAVAIHGDGFPSFVNCAFHDNGVASDALNIDVDAAPIAGGALYSYSGRATFVNCLFYNNKAGEGGALWINWLSNPTFTNCTFVKNHSKVNPGGAIYDSGGTTTARNCIFWNNTMPLLLVDFGTQIYDPESGTLVSYSDVQGGWGGTANFNLDPLFVNPGVDYYQLQQNSPCKNSGNNSALPFDLGDLDWDTDVSEVIPKDLVPSQRRVGVNVDVGAYEYQELFAFCNTSLDCISGRACCGNTCEACCTDGDCPAFAHHCITDGLNVCVQCLNDTHCSSGKECCPDNTCETIGMCPVGPE
ncbi:MAG: right-handed parallel beta-helix repeat-containing protein [Phycisphaerales bacterium]|nr:right-handed parallel beta-helix repeat-containing protein [Phycisphaerales bacterium]